MRKLVEVYQGYELIASGTVEQCAAKLKVKPGTIKFYLTPAYERRLAKRNNIENARTAIRLDDDV